MAKESSRVVRGAPTCKGTCELTQALGGPTESLLLEGEALIFSTLTLENLEDSSVSLRFPLLSPQAGPCEGFQLGREARM